MIYYYFLWNLFSLLGYTPELSHCVGCRRKLLPETLFFVPEEGGVVCWQCLSNYATKQRETLSPSATTRNHAKLSIEIPLQEQEQKGFLEGQKIFPEWTPLEAPPLTGWKEIPVNVVKILRLFLQKPFAAIEKLRINKADLKNLKEISELYLAYLESQR